MSIFYITDIFSRLCRVASRYYIVHIRINTALRHCHDYGTLALWCRCVLVGNVDLYIEQIRVIVQLLVIT